MGTVFFVLSQFTRLTDRRTDRRTESLGNTVRCITCSRTVKSKYFIDLFCISLHFVTAFKAFALE